MLLRRFWTFFSSPWKRFVPHEREHQRTVERSLHTPDVPSERASERAADADVVVDTLAPHDRVQQRTAEGSVDSPAVPREPVSERTAETQWDVPEIPAEVVEMPSAFQDRIQRCTNEPNVNVAVLHTLADVLQDARVRPPPLVEVRPQGDLQRHTGGDMEHYVPVVQVLDAPEPQMLGEMVEVLNRFQQRTVESHVRDDAWVMVTTEEQGAYYSGATTSTWSEWMSRTPSGRLWIPERVCAGQVHWQEAEDCDCLSGSLLCYCLIGGTGSGARGVLPIVSTSTADCLQHGEGSDLASFLTILSLFGLQQ